MAGPASRDVAASCVRQLQRVALAQGGAGVREFVEQTVATATSPGAAIRAHRGDGARQLSRSRFELGCPIATVTLEMASRSDAIRQAVSDAFESWIEPLAQLMVAHDRARQEALQLATWAVAGLEGALVLARAAHHASLVTTCAEVTAAVLDVPASPAS